MTEGLELYKEFGKTYTIEQRQLAAEAAISFLYGTDWGVDKTVSFVAPGVDRLLAFAGDEAFLLAGRKMDIMNLPDTIDKKMVEDGINSLWEAFDFKQSPHGRKYWVEVVRNARLAAGIPV